MNIKIFIYINDISLWERLWNNQIVNKWIRQLYDNNFVHQAHWRLSVSQHVLKPPKARQDQHTKRSIHKGPSYMQPKWRFSEQLCHSFIIFWEKRIQIRRPQKIHQRSFDDATKQTVGGYRENQTRPAIDLRLRLASECRTPSISIEETFRHVRIRVYPSPFSCEICPTSLPPWKWTWVHFYSNTASGWN